MRRRGPSSSPKFPNPHQNKRYTGDGEADGRPTIFLAVAASGTLPSGIFADCKINRLQLGNDQQKKRKQKIHEPPPPAPRKSCLKLKKKKKTQIGFPPGKLLWEKKKKVAFSRNWGDGGVLRERTKKNKTKTTALCGPSPGGLLLFPPRIFVPGKNFSSGAARPSAAGGPPPPVPFFATNPLRYVNFFRPPIGHGGTVKFLGGHSRKWGQGGAI